MRQERLAFGFGDLYTIVSPIKSIEAIFQAGSWWDGSYEDIYTGMSDKELRQDFEGFRKTWGIKDVRPILEMTWRRDNPFIGEDPLVLKQMLLEYGEKWLALANNRFRDYDLEN